jgi:hypothetical protein
MPREIRTTATSAELSETLFAPSVPGQRTVTKQHRGVLLMLIFTDPGSRHP